MEKHPQKIAATGVVRADGSFTPFNAGDAVAAVSDMYGLPMLPSWKARLGERREASCWRTTSPPTSLWSRC